MGSNPVLLLTHNCLDLTKKCVESLRNQDIPTTVFVADNGSSDDTVAWTQEQQIPCLTLLTNTGFSYGINMGLKWVFELTGADHCFVANNDTVFGAWTYRELLAYDAPFVTGISVDNMDVIAAPEPRKELGPGPDFSAWLVKKECWEKVGGFDESMVSYASDLDLHIRAHRLGIPLMNAGIPFYHERSSTLRNANPKERRVIEMQADADRLVFYRKYGFHTWSPEYSAQFTPENFGIAKK